MLGALVQWVRRRAGRPAPHGASALPSLLDAEVAAHPAGQAGLGPVDVLADGPARRELAGLDHVLERSRRDGQAGADIGFLEQDGGSGRGDGGHRKVP